MPSDPLDEPVDAVFATDGAAPSTADPTHLFPPGDPAPARLPSAQGMRYEPVRFHARGGLGEVYVAQDSELHRAVALKCLRPAASRDPVSRRRFLREAEITGRLEHPGVVPIYGLLQSAEGQPFYAMRFIEGDTLQSAIKRYHDPKRLDIRNILELRTLLQRFVSVCDTMAYAHSRGVVHRDLKPHNVMLGPFGEVLVVDWGLAKDTGVPDNVVVPVPTPDIRSSEPDPEVSETQAGSVVGTPAYMSPEQADGATDSLGPASDIFSLGAILFAILTGRPPYVGTTVVEALDRARAVRFDPPRSIRSDTPPALEAIALRAMAAKPGDRYATARELGADIERWLADEPDAAFGEPRTVRARRWMRRHRTLVTAAVSLLATAVAGLALGLIAVNSERKQTEERRREAEFARLQADASARSAAEHRTIALQTLQALIFDMQREMADRPGLQRLQQTLLLSAQRGLERLARSVDASDEADRTKAAALLQLGDVYVQYADIGGFGAAHAQFERALELCRRMLVAAPDDRDLNRQMAHCLIRLGDVALPLGRSGEAETHYRAAHAIARELAAAGPDDTLAKIDLADAEQRLGDIAQARGHNAAALAAFRESNRLCRELADAAPADTARQVALARSLERLAGILLVAGRELDAVGEYEKQLKILNRLASDGKPAIALRRDIAIAHQNIGNCYRMNGQVDRAVPRFREASDRLSTLERDDPDNVQVRASMAITLYLLGYTEWLLGRLDAAKTATDGAQDRLRKLIEADPRNITYRTRYGRAVVTYVNVLLQRGQVDEALELARSTVASFKSLSLADPEQVNLRVEVANSVLTLTIATMYVGKLDEARTAVAEGLALARTLQQSGAIAANRFGESTLLLLECKAAQLAGDPAAIVVAAERVAAIPGTGWLAPFHAACALGWADKAIRRGRPLEQLDGPDRAEIVRLGQRAIELLRTSARLGMRNADVYNRMPELAPFRALAEMRALIAEMESTPKP